MVNRFLYPDDPNYPSRKRLWIKDPVDGGLILRDSSREMLFKWCEEHCQSRYWVGMGFIDFESENDFVLAVLCHK
jgi:hypothetical protein